VRVLLVDAMTVAYSSFYRFKTFHTTTNIPTGLRYGFMRGIAHAAEKFEVDKVVICWDVKGPLKRTELFPNYKSNRVMTEEKDTLYSQLLDLQQMIQLTWWTQAKAPGYEADDIIGSLTRKLVEQGHYIHIMTSDADLQQLVGDNCYVYWPKPAKNEEEVKTITSVKDKWGVAPEGLLLWRAMEGDKSDNIPPAIKLNKLATAVMKAAIGLYVSSYQVGQHRPDLFVDWWRKQMAVERVLNPIDKNLRNQIIKGLDSGVINLYHRNWLLMRLQDPETIELSKGTASLDKLTDLFTQLEFASLMKYVPDYVRPKWTAP